MSGERRRAVFYITARPRDARAARGLISRSIRSMLGSRYALGPYCCAYESAASLAREYGTSPRLCLARYAAQLTDVEFEAICFAIQVEAEREGWASCPVECVRR